MSGNFGNLSLGFGSSKHHAFVGIIATGGTITTDGDYKVHTFNSSGTFNYNFR
jgi:L-asparaginase/Glu-tRNA(Gln) amidotransferase subunit D